MGSSVDLSWTSGTDPLDHGPVEQLAILVVGLGAGRALRPLRRRRGGVRHPRPRPGRRARHVRGRLRRSRPCSPPRWPAPAATCARAASTGGSPPWPWPAALPGTLIGGLASAPDRRATGSSSCPAVLLLVVGARVLLPGSDRPRRPLRRPPRPQRPDRRARLRRRAPHRAPRQRRRLPPRPRLHPASSACPRRPPPGTSMRGRRRAQHPHPARPLVARPHRLADRAAVRARLGAGHLPRAPAEPAHRRPLGPPAFGVLLVAFAAVLPLALEPSPRLGGSGLGARLEGGGVSLEPVAHLDDRRRPGAAAPFRCSKVL